MEAKTLLALLNEPLLLGSATRHCGQAHPSRFAAQVLLLQLFRLHGWLSFPNGRYLHWHYTLQKHLQTDPSYASDVIGDHKSQNRQ